MLVYGGVGVTDLVMAPGVYPLMMAEIVKYSVLYCVPTRPITLRNLLLRKDGR